MKFKYDGSEYAIEFQRRHRDVTIIRHGIVKVVKSTHPYTTAKLLRKNDLGEYTTVEAASVGCAKFDTFNIAEGRVQALRTLSVTLRKRNHEKELSAAMWNAYLNRKGTKAHVTSTTVEEIQIINTVPIIEHRPEVIH
jgi:hypothetical protein